MNWLRASYDSFIDLDQIAKIAFSEDQRSARLYLCTAGEMAPAFEHPITDVSAIQRLQATVHENSEWIRVRDIGAQTAGSPQFVRLQKVRAVRFQQAPDGAWMAHLLGACGILGEVRNQRSLDLIWDWVNAGTVAATHSLW